MFEIVLHQFMFTPFCPIRAYSHVCVAGLQNLTFLFQGEERQHKQENKQTNKQKKFCLIWSEAETHDVISDSNVINFFTLGWMFGSGNM